MAHFSSLSDYFAYVLLTASDGIDCAFLLLAADLSPSRAVEVRSPVTSVSTHPRSHGSRLHRYCSTIVLAGGVVCWAMRGGCDGYHILTLSYNVCTRTATAGSIKHPMNRLPKHYSNMVVGYDADLRLASSPDGRLTMIVRDRLRIFVWLLSAGGGWVQHAVIDTTAETTLMPLPPKGWVQSSTIQLLSSWERSGMVLFYMVGDGESDLVALDVETNEMHRVDGHRHMPFIPFKVDLESRLSTMKTF